MTEHRFYGDLAVWWPLISPPEEHAEEAAHVATLLDSASGPVLDVLQLGSGGGHNAVHLLAEAGFEAEAVTEQTTEDRTPRELFVGHRHG
jgi:hypothetical protein